MNYTEKRNWQDLLNLVEEFDGLYIYGFASAGKWIHDNLKGKIKVLGFIECDLKKSGHNHDGTEVLYYKDLLEREISKEKARILIINTVTEISATWQKGLDLNATLQVPLGLFLNGHPLSEVADVSGEFLGYFLNAVKESHNSFFIGKGLFLRSIDILVTERCSMKCQDCSNLMQYYQKPENIEVEQMIKEIEILLSKIDYLYEIRLIGGEPFVNRHIYEMISYCTNLDKVSYVVLYTNATVPLNINKLKASGSNLSKISFQITNYGKELSRQLEQVTQSLDDLKIPYRAHSPEWWTDSGRIIHEHRTKDELEILFENCCGKHLLTLTDNKLYRCPFAANADRLKGIPHNKDNYVEITASPSDIAKYTKEIKYLPACEYCKGRSWDSPQIDAAIQTKKPIEYKKYE